MARAGWRLTICTARSAGTSVSDTPRIDAIALQAFGPPKRSQLGTSVGVAVENAQQHFLMIAKQEDGPRTGRR